MSFTEDVIREALSLQAKKACCRRAFALGLFFSAKRDGKRLVSSFINRDTAEAAAELLLKIFHSEADITEQNKAGRISYALTFSSSAISELLKTADSEDERPAHIAIGFKCEGCEAAFLRGVLVAGGSISDPKKAYNMELSFPCAERAERIRGMIERRLFSMGKIQRASRHCLYCKNNGSIADLLYYIGCSKSGLSVTNSWIERDIRNNENRATNCVARNISRSVGASMRQISAIERLSESGKLERLPEELRYTARLRLENDSATMVELAALHSPPITKSGLNGRLKRLMEAAEEE